MEGNTGVRYAECVRQFGEQNSDNHCESIGFDVYNFAITGGGVENAQRNSNGFRPHPMRTCTERSGGAVMNVSYDVTASLRANMKHHEPVVLCLEHHPADSRIKVKDDDVCQSLTSRMGTGGATYRL